ncbi:MAG: hypothetical protein P1U32_04880 [Legionellaceae bacterium]|nr:hypothetical protein [Legionellaceae bacterium]
MLPMVLLGAPIFTATADLTIYLGAAGIGGLGVAIGYLLPKRKKQDDKNGKNTHSYTSTSSYTAHETTQLKKAEMLQVESRKKRQVVLNQIGNAAVEEIERVVEASYKARLKMSSLMEAFEGQLTEMNVTTQGLKEVISLLNKANKSSGETIHILSTDINTLKEALFGASQKLLQATHVLSFRDEALQKVIEDLSHLKNVLDETQRAHEAEMQRMSTSLSGANQKIKAQCQYQGSQAEHIKTLQEKIGKLTTTLRAVTDKGERYAKALQQVQLKNEVQALELSHLKAQDEKSADTSSITAMRVV